MNYHWAIAHCLCHLAVNWMVRPGEILGSLRRWSADRSTNDGKAFQLPGAPVGPDRRFVRLRRSDPLPIRRTPSAASAPMTARQAHRRLRSADRSAVRRLS